MWKLNSFRQFCFKLAVRIFSIFFDKKMLAIVPSENSGRKRKRTPENWKNNLIKLFRNLGLEYISKSGKVVPEKIFRPVRECCIWKKCGEKISVNLQESYFLEFWGFGNYFVQNAFLRNLYTFREAKEVNAVHHYRLKIYDYYFPLEDKYESVCQKFYLNVIQISEKRLFGFFVKKLRTNKVWTIYRECMCTQKNLLLK